MQKEILEHSLNINRRRFLSRLSLGIGSAALGSLLIPDLFGSSSEEETIVTGLPHFPPKAKRIIYLFQNGAPSQLDLFDYKPKLNEMFGEELPASVRMNRRSRAPTMSPPPTASKSRSPRRPGAQGRSIRPSRTSPSMVNIPPRSIRSAGSSR